MWIMTALEARLFAGRALRAAQVQEEFARSLRPGADIPLQRDGDTSTVPSLTLVGGTSH
jgi:hypothetical protein